MSTFSTHIKEEEQDVEMSGLYEAGGSSTAVDSKDWYHRGSDEDNKLKEEETDFGARDPKLELVPNDQSSHHATLRNIVPHTSEEVRQRNNAQWVALFEGEYQRGLDEVRLYIPGQTGQTLSCTRPPAPEGDLVIEYPVFEEAARERASRAVQQTGLDMQPPPPGALAQIVTTHHAIRTARVGDGEDTLLDFKLDYSWLDPQNITHFIGVQDCSLIFPETGRSFPTAVEHASSDLTEGLLAAKVAKTLRGHIECDLYEYLMTRNDVPQQVLDLRSLVPPTLCDLHASIRLRLVEPGDDTRPSDSSKTFRSSDGYTLEAQATVKGRAWDAQRYQWTSILPGDELQLIVPLRETNLRPFTIPKKSLAFESLFVQTQAPEQR